MGTFEELGLKYSTVSALLGLFISAAAVAAVLMIVFYALKAAGICDMSAGIKIKNPWYSFVPVLSAYSIGRLAARGKKSSLSVILTVLELLYIGLCVYIITAALFGFIEVIFAADKALAAGKELSDAEFSLLTSVSMPILLLFPVMLARKLLTLVCAFKIFKVFSGGREVPFTVLAFIFPFLLPIFLFTVRNNEPDFSPTEKDKSITGFHYG